MNKSVGTKQLLSSEELSSSLRFAPSTLVHLGERLVANIDQGISELVKNAYDADASGCEVSVDNREGGWLRVSDDGFGMTSGELDLGWLVLGRSEKHSKKLTPKFNRVPVGDKGLGRLSALRLGRVATIETRPESQPGVQYSVSLDWDDYDGAQTVEAVELKITTVPTERAPGTDILVDKLRRPLDRVEMERLARTLILLSDPFVEVQGFRATLAVPEFEDLSNKVRGSYFGDAHFHVRATLDVNGGAHYELLDWKNEVLTSGEGTKRENCVPAAFDLWIYLLDRRSFSTRDSTISEVRDWLSIVGGVHVFEGPIRVSPYGERGVDWLEMNLRRAQSPEERPSTNTSVGRVVVDNSSGKLEQKTDRVGYIENETFAELRSFAKEALNWAAKYRLQVAERRRQEDRKKATAQRQTVTARVDQLLETVAETERKPLKRAVEKLVAVSERQEKRLRADLQLYRSLATAGMTAAVFAHEIGKPLGVLTRTLPSMVNDFPPELQEKAQKIISFAVNAAARLGAYVSLPLNLLKKEKRRPGRVDLGAAVSDIITTFDPIFVNARINVDIPHLEPTHINGSLALVEGIMANLFANSITAFEREGVDQTGRKIVVAIEPGGDHVNIRVSDNAGGIRGVELDQIWLPGVTTAPEGTGFGLTIVKDSVTDLGGTIKAIVMGEFGGAEFLMRFQRL